MRYLLLVITIGLLSACNTPTNDQTIQGVFHTDKGCMGSVNGVLLLDFVNDCERAELYEGKFVEVTGEIHSVDYCPPDEQCALGDRMSNIKSIKILDEPVQ